MTMKDRNSMHEASTPPVTSSNLKKDPKTGGSLPDIMIRDEKNNWTRPTDCPGVGTNTGGSKSIWYIGNKRDSSGSSTAGLLPSPTSGKAAPLASREVCVNNQLLKLTISKGHLVVSQFLKLYLTISKGHLVLKLKPNSTSFN